MPAKASHAADGAAPTVSDMLKGLDAMGVEPCDVVEDLSAILEEAGYVSDAEDLDGHCGHLDEDF